ncbi:hypothetical protein M0805_000724 [Coniferiporia weirii]|nr:hypothetical protein M0805_000724 [Coniferiporia weirii]
MLKGSTERLHHPLSQMTSTALKDSYLILSSFIIPLIASLVILRNRKLSLPLPPGPRPLPLIQNLLDLPKGFEAFHWAKHKHLYGPISSLSVLGTTIIILNDAQVAFDLLEKRSAIYSDRPSFPFGGDILLEEPSGLIKHIRTTARAIILRISYGYTITHHDRDPLIDLADDVLIAFSKSIVPGRWIVDIFPSQWIPGLNFKRKAREWNKATMDLLNKPFAFVKHQMRTGNEIPSSASSLIVNNILDEHVMKWIAATLYGGGADTTVSAAATFFLAMALHPDVFKKAQAEIDGVIGRGNLPLLTDRDRLPCIEAVEKESWRWNNVAPVNTPHVLSEEDTYMGYRIPRGAIVLANTWQITHDPTVYHDPFTFEPERFLGENAEPDPRALVFGFGRRICPGKELAGSSLFISIAMSAAVFDISRAKDASGNDINPLCEYTTGLISHPKAFEYSIKPRDKKAELLIRSVIYEHPFETGDAGIFAGISV